MSLIFTIVYAAHANGTHHKLALDALRELERPDAEAWRRVFLKHADVYLSGSKAPDTEFKDFKNHVLHVRDGYWGGAPEKVQSWYGHLVEALKEADFERAVYSAGVLSHYYTDPIHPFHTAQSEAENNVHRAVEWSINRSYDALRAEGLARPAENRPTTASGPDWLKAHVLAGADRANPAYETLITHYDLHTGVVDPPAGLDPIARAAVASLILYAAKGFAAVLDRAISEAGVAAPEVSLSAETVLATLKIPVKWVAKKITDAETRRQVQAMYDELMATGRVEANLPADDRMVRDLYRAEVLEPRAVRQAAERAERVQAAAVVRPVAAPRPAASAPAVLAGHRPAPANVAAVDTPRAAVRPERSDIVTPVPFGRDGLASLALKPRTYLTEGDDLERAPSIGPKLAERFAAGGIRTVAEFLAADADRAVALLGDGRFTTATIARWKDEATLVLRVPGLRGTHAQLLAGAGFASPQALADADPMHLSAALLSYATTPEGVRILRSGDAPDVEAVTRWVRSAREALAA